MAERPMPDLSHLNAEERKIIEELFRRQWTEEEKEAEIAALIITADMELDDIDRLINERKEKALRLVGSLNDAICQICRKTKFADGIGHKCFYCHLRSCARCGGRTTEKTKQIWACSLCQKRQKILVQTTEGFHQHGGQEEEGPGDRIEIAASLPTAADRTPSFPLSQQRPYEAAKQEMPEMFRQEAAGKLAWFKFRLLRRFKGFIIRRFRCILLRIKSKIRARF